MSFIEKAIIDIQTGYVKYDVGGFFDGTIVNNNAVSDLKTQLKFGARILPVTVKAGFMMQLSDVLLDYIVCDGDFSICGLVKNKAQKLPSIFLSATNIVFDIPLSSHRDTVKKNVGLTYLASTTVTTNGDTKANPLSVDYGSVIVFFLNVTAVSGTSPTLDLYVDIQDPASGEWINQDKFTQFTAVGRQALALPVRSNRYSVRWVLGGTTPSFKFSVGVVIVK